MRLGTYVRGGFIDDSSEGSPCNQQVLIHHMDGLAPVRETMQELNTTRHGQSITEKSQAFSILGVSNKTIQGVKSPKQAQSPRESLRYQSLIHKTARSQKLSLKYAVSRSLHSSVLNNSMNEQGVDIACKLLELDTEKKAQGPVLGKDSSSKLVIPTETSTQKPASTPKGSDVFDFVGLQHVLKLKPSNKGNATVNFSSSAGTRKQSSPILAKKPSVGLEDSPNSRIRSSQLVLQPSGSDGLSIPLRKVGSISFIRKPVVSSRRIAIKPKLQHLLPALGDLEGKLSNIDNSFRDTSNFSKVESFDIENVPIDDKGYDGRNNRFMNSCASGSYHRNSIGSAHRSRNLKKSTFGTFIKSQSNGDSIYQFVNDGQIPQFMESIAFDAQSGVPSTTPKYSLFAQSPSDQIANRTKPRALLKLDTVFDVEGELKNAVLLNKYIEAKMNLQRARVAAELSSQNIASRAEVKVNQPRSAGSGQQVNLDNTSFTGEPTPKQVPTLKSPKKAARNLLSPQSIHMRQAPHRQKSQDSSSHLTLNHSQLISEPHVTAGNIPT